MVFLYRFVRIPLSLLAVSLAFPVAGQPVTASASAPASAPLPPIPGVDESAWLYKGSDITPDAAWKFGTLPNGLRFAVRHNGVPPGQVAVRVRIDAGSLEESDAQQGYAHFIEHLTFRGSEYVPDGEAKRVWQRMGTTFGSDTNAQTTATQTVYKLDLPSATEANLDESLKILSGMMADPAITDTTVAAERPVVLAERREQPGPQVRFGDAIRQTFFAGQRLADRSPIGTVATLDAATGASVKAFHDAWYRPTRTVVVISGDMDPAVFARLIAKHFADWRGAGVDRADPDFGKPDPSQPTAGTLIEPGLPALTAMAVLRPWQFNADTVIFNQKRMIDILATRLLSRRLEARARSGGSFLQAGVSIDDVSRSANLTSVNIVPLGNRWDTALKDVRAVIADAQATPPTAAEVDREYADLDAIMRNDVETARVEAGAKQADDMVQALDIRETVTSPATSYAILKDAKAKGMFTPATVFASTKKIFEGTATRAVVNTPTPEPNVLAGIAAALKANVAGLAGRRREQATIAFSALPTLPPAGTVASDTTIAGLDLRQIVFANGVHLLLFPNSGETGRVYVRVRFGRGYNALPANRATPAWAGDIALMQSGIGKLDQGDLDQMTTGRQLGLDFGIDDDAFQIAGLSSPEDYPDQLKLIVAKLAFPGWDPAPVARARAVFLTGYAGYDSSPDGVLSRDLEGLLRAGDPRWTTPTREQAAKLDARTFRALWQPLIASGPIEVSVFGDVKADAAIRAVAATFGALPPRTASDAPPPPVRFPAHVATPVLRTHDGPANQAAAVIAWPTGAGIDGIRDARTLDVLAQVFSDRLFERLRQAAGASYSPNVQSQWPIGLPDGGRLIAIGQVTPDKVGFFFQMAREIAADLVAHPVGPDELQRLKGPMEQQLLRASTGNQFWLQQLGGATFDPRRIEATRNIARDLASVTPADLQAVAAKYLVPDRDWTMAVVPKGK